MYMTRAKENPEMTVAFYHQLSQIYNEEKRGATSIFTIGDFNAKVGKFRDGDNSFMGKRGKGERNDNGEALQQSLVGNGVCLVNTRFKRRDRQVAIWHKAPSTTRSKSRRRGAGAHNQIDYTVTPRHMVKLFTDAKSTEMMRRRADHSTALGKVTLQALHKLPRAQSRKKVKKASEAVKIKKQSALGGVDLMDDYMPKHG